MDYTDNLQSGLPLGLAFGMAMDEQAINHYGKMTEYEKEQVIARCKKQRGNAAAHTENQ